MTDQRQMLLELMTAFDKMGQEAHEQPGLPPHQLIDRCAMRARSVVKAYRDALPPDPPAPDKPDGLEAKIEAVCEAERKWAQADRGSEEKDAARRELHNTAYALRVYRERYDAAPQPAPDKPADEMEETITWICGAYREWATGNPGPPITDMRLFRLLLAVGRLNLLREIPAASGPAPKPAADELRLERVDVAKLGEKYHGHRGTGEARSSGSGLTYMATSTQTAFTACPEVEP